MDGGLIPGHSRIDSALQDGSAAGPEVETESEVADDHQTDSAL